MTKTEPVTRRDGWTYIYRRVDGATFLRCLGYVRPGEFDGEFIAKLVGDEPQVHPNRSEAERALEAMTGVKFL